MPDLGRWPKTETEKESKIQQSPKKPKRPYWHLSARTKHETDRAGRGGRELVWIGPLVIKPPQRRIVKTGIELCIVRHPFPYVYCASH